MRKMFSEKQIKEFIATEKKDITTLVDSAGHDRFIEGDITCEEITGVTQTYGKWSLSCSHLLIVIGYYIADATTTSAGILAKINVPQWILDKIIPTYATTIYASVFSGYNDAGTTVQSLTHVLKKESSGLQVNVAGITTTDKRNYRIAFDLLID